MGEAVAGAGRRRDQLVGSARGAERAAQGEDGLADVGGVDGLARPDRVKQLVAGHHLAGVLDQIEQRVEQRRRQSDGGAATRQRAPRRVEDEILELVVPARTYRYVHRPASPCRLRRACGQRQY